jgi:hypothetical protein
VGKVNLCGDGGVPVGNDGASSVETETVGVSTGRATWEGCGDGADIETGAWLQAARAMAAQVGRTRRTSFAFMATGSGWGCGSASGCE